MPARAMTLERLMDILDHYKVGDETELWIQVKSPDGIVMQIPVVNYKVEEATWNPVVGMEGGKVFLLDYRD